MENLKVLKENILICTQSNEGFQKTYSQVIGPIQQSSELYIEFFFKQISDTLTSKQQSPRTKFYCMLVLLKAAELKNYSFYHFFVKECDLLNYIFDTALFQAHVKIPPNQRGADFFSKNPTEKEALMGVNYVRLCQEHIIDWNICCKGFKPKKYFEIFSLFLGKIKKLTSISKPYIFISKDFDFNQDIASCDFYANPPYRVPLSRMTTLAEEVAKKENKLNQSGSSSRLFSDSREYMANDYEDDIILSNNSVKQIKPEKPAFCIWQDGMKSLKPDTERRVKTEYADTEVEKTSVIQRLRAEIAVAKTNAALTDRPKTVADNTGLPRDMVKQESKRTVTYADEKTIDYAHEISEARRFLLIEEKKEEAEHTFAGHDFQINITQYVDPTISAITAKHGILRNSSEAFASKQAPLEGFQSSAGLSKSQRFGNIMKNLTQPPSPETNMSPNLTQRKGSFDQKTMKVNNRKNLQKELLSIQNCIQKSQHSSTKNSMPQSRASPNDKNVHFDFSQGKTGKFEMKPIGSHTTREFPRSVPLTTQNSRELGPDSYKPLDEPKKDSIFKKMNSMPKEPEPMAVTATTLDHLNSLFQEYRPKSGHVKHKSWQSESTTSKVADKENSGINSITEKLKQFQQETPERPQNRRTSLIVPGASEFKRNTYADRRSSVVPTKPPPFMMTENLDKIEEENMNSRGHSNHDLDSSKGVKGTRGLTREGTLIGFTEENAGQANDEPHYKEENKMLKRLLEEYEQKMKGLEDKLAHVTKENANLKRLVQSRGIPIGDTSDVDDSGTDDEDTRWKGKGGATPIFGSKNRLKK